MSIYKLFAYQDKTAEIADLQDAYKYMQLFEYSDKITKIGNLQIRQFVGFVGFVQIRNICGFVLM